MGTKQTDVVSASEIASWVWCPESWRLDALVREAGNQDALARGRKFHSRTAAVEVWSRRAAWFARSLLVIAVLLAALWYALARGVG